MKIKAKGAYESKRDWHQNQSMLIVPKAVEANFVNGRDIAEFIYEHTDMLDFCLRTKISKSDKLMHGDQLQQRVTRYYVSTSGESLRKIMPPTGVEGAYKRKNKLSDHTYEKIVAELRAEPRTFIRKEEGYWTETAYWSGRDKDIYVQPRYFYMINGSEIETDSTGLQWDERIHNKSKTKHNPQRITKLHGGRPVKICNDITTEKFDTIDYDWYIEQAEKLVNGIDIEEE